MTTTLTANCVVLQSNGLAPKPNSKKTACGLRAWKGQLVTTHGSWIMRVTVVDGKATFRVMTDRLAEVPRDADGKADFEALNATVAPYIGEADLAKFGYAMDGRTLVAASAKPKGRKAAKQPEAAPAKPATTARRSRKAPKASPSMVKAPAKAESNVAAAFAFLKAMSAEERAALAALLAQ